MLLRLHKNSKPTLYINYGNTNYTDDITHLEHALQCAYRAQAEYPNDRELILGSFLHDVGHLVSLKDLHENNKYKVIEYENKPVTGLGLVNHDEVGALFLNKMGFSDRISNFSKYHVITMRYLITKDPSYLDRLSATSKETFLLYGGTMKKDELDDFELNENKDNYIAMSQWDDEARELNYSYDKTRKINYYQEMANDLLIKK